MEFIVIYSDTSNQVWQIVKQDKYRWSIYITNIHALQ